MDAARPFPTCGKPKRSSTLSRPKTLLSVCVEVCSAAFYLDDDPGVLISACLFGDAAGAAVSSAIPPKDQRSVKTVTWCSQLKAHQRDALRFEQRKGMLRNILSPETPFLAATSAHEDFQKALMKEKMDPLHGHGCDPRWRSARSGCDYPVNESFTPLT